MERMSGENEIVKELANAFCIALLLTGNVEATEAALLDGIAASELDRISGDSLLLATTKSAMHRRMEIPEQSEELSILPLELRRLFLLAPNCRDCFVLRALIGLSPELCSGILHLSIHEVENTLCMALQELPCLETWDITGRDSVHPAEDATVDRYTSTSGVYAWPLAR